MHEKYSHYKKDKAINTILEKLEYTMRMANRKIEEIEDINDDMQARLSELFQRHFDEMENTTDKPNKLILSGNKALIGYTMASKAKDTTQERNT